MLKIYIKPWATTSYFEVGNSSVNIIFYFKYLLEFMIIFNLITAYYIYKMISSFCQLYISHIIVLLSYVL